MGKESEGRNLDTKKESRVARNWNYSLLRTKTTLEEACRSKLLGIYPKHLFCGVGEGRLDGGIEQSLRRESVVKTNSRRCAGRGGRIWPRGALMNQNGEG